MEGDLKALIANSQPEASSVQQTNLPDLGMTHDKYVAVLNEMRSLNQRPAPYDQSLPSLTVDANAPGLKLPQKTLSDGETGMGCSVLSSVPVAQLSPMQLFKTLQGIQTRNKLDRAEGKPTAFEVAPILMADGQKISLELLYARDANSISSPVSLMKVEYDARDQNRIIDTACSSSNSSETTEKHVNYYPHTGNANDLPLEETKTMVLEAANDSVLLFGHDKQKAEYAAEKILSSKGVASQNPVAKPFAWTSADEALTNNFIKLAHALKQSYQQ